MLILLKLLFMRLRTVFIATLILSSAQILGGDRQEVGIPIPQVIATAQAQQRIPVPEATARITASISTEEWVALQEGLKLVAYLDLRGCPTIGYGHKLSENCNSRLKHYPPITKERALELLAQDLKKYRALIKRTVTAYMFPDQETALISLAYNIGPGAFGSSKLVRLINAGASEAAITAEWLSWNQVYMAGRYQVSRGIANRRAREVELFFGRWTP